MSHSSGAPHPSSAVMRLAWMGDGAPRMEVAHIEQSEPYLIARGTQLGATYELRYSLGPDTLLLDLVGGRKLELGLDGADYFDLAWSPLFNSLPVLRDRLFAGGTAREYQMRWVDVPSLEIRMSRQRYEPLRNGIVRFTAGEFCSDIRFDEAGFVISYPGLGMRVDNLGEQEPSPERISPRDR